MDTSTINTLITACASLLVAWIGFQVKKYADESVLPRKAIRGKTLSDVLVPVLNVSNVLNRYTWDEQEKLLITLLNEKQVLIPPALATQMQCVLSSDESSRECALQNLNIMAEAYANWYRKHLGYPYDESKIDKRYTANTQRNETIKGWVSLILYVAWALCALYMVFAFIYLSEHNYEAELTPLNLAPVIFFAFGVPFAAIKVER